MPEPVTVAEGTQVKEQTAGLENFKDLLKKPEVLAAIAPLVREEMLAQYGQDVGQAIANAKEEIGTRPAAVVAPARQSETPYSKRNKRPKMDELEQQAEWLRCKYEYTMNRQFEVDPDLDGEQKVVTEALRHCGVPVVNYAQDMIQQAYTPTTATAGGNAVPDEFVAELEKRPEETQDIWPKLNKRPTSREAVTKPEITAYPTVNKGSASNALSATTATEITETQATLGQLTWTMRDFDAYFEIKLTLIQDSPLAIYQELLDVTKDAFWTEREREPLIGNGVLRPQGMLDAISGLTNVSIGAALTFASLLNVIDNLPKRYRANASMVVTAQGLFDIVGDMAANVNSPEFLTRFVPMITRLVDSPYMEEGKVLVGDFSRYVVYHNTLMQIVTDVTAARVAQGVAIIERWDGQVTITDAFRIGRNATYT